MKHLSKRGARRLLRCTGRLLMQVALLLWYPELPLLATMLQVGENSKATCSLLALYFVDALCYPQGTHIFLFSHCCVILSAFIITFFSFIFLMPPPPDKCVYGIFHIYKPLHKLLSKINKRRAERGGGKNEGQERKNIERESYVMLERPLRVLSIFPSIFSVQACICHH